MSLPYLLLLIACVVGALLITALLVRKDNRPANLVLCLILAMALYFQYIQLARLTGDLARHPHLIGTGFAASLLIPSLVYLYVLALTVPGFTWNKALWRHLIPFACGLLFFAYLWLSGSQLRLETDPERMAWGKYLATVVDVVVSGIYFYACFRQIQAYRATLTEHFSELRRVRLQWLKILLLVVVLPWAIQLIDVLTGPFIDMEPVIIPVMTAVFLLMGFFGLRQSVIFTADEVWPAPASAEVAMERAVAAELKSQAYFSEQKLLEWKEKLEKHVAQEQPYLNPELRLSHLAESLGLKPYQVSEILNRGIKSSFYDYINRCRVEEVKRRFADPAFAHMNILGIAIDSGFNSKSVFNETFRKFAGQTPSAFRQAQNSGPPEKK